jgi:hypothetical protein
MRAAKRCRRLLALPEVSHEAWRIIEAGRSANDAFPAWNRGAWIVLAETRKRAVDEPPIRFGHLGGTETESIHERGAEPFDYHIRRLDKTQGELTIFCAAKVLERCCVCLAAR